MDDELSRNERLNEDGHKPPRKDGWEPETVLIYCEKCDEEYEVPEDLKQCPNCGADVEEA